MARRNKRPHVQHVPREFIARVHVNVDALHNDLAHDHPFDHGKTKERRDDPERQSLEEALNVASVEAGVDGSDAKVVLSTGHGGKLAWRRKCQAKGPAA